MESYTLFQLNEYIRRVVALNFREPLWIEAEIAQIRDSRGNRYIELVEKAKDGDEVIAQISGAIWYRNFQFIKKKLGDLVHELLVEGTQVRIKCTVDYHERYGLKLIIQDIDPNYTFGQLEIKRQEIINRLEEEGLMELNKSLVIPDVIQKIAVISSENAAGFQDFQNHLTNNAYGFTFKVDLYNCAVQGVKVEEDTIAAIKEILQKDTRYDMVAIIRGGGSKLDLSGYDNYEIARSIALSEIPFVIGIGHDIDSTVTDLVACLSLKTPTAVADYIIEQNLSFEAKVEQTMAMIQRASINTLRQHELRLKSFYDKLRLGARNLVSEESGALNMLNAQMGNSVKNKLRNTLHYLERMSLTLDSRDPLRILSQGYSFIKKRDNVVNSVKKLAHGDEVEIHLFDGHVKSKIL